MARKMRGATPQTMQLIALADTLLRRAQVEITRATRALEAADTPRATEKAKAAHRAVHFARASAQGAQRHAAHRVNRTVSP